MDETVRFLTQHGYLLLFLFVVGERFGLPLPALPVLAGAGALARQGALSPLPLLGVAVAGCLVADGAWYGIGRRRGGRVLGWLCRIALEPDSCARRAERIHARLGSPALVLSKFVPGLGPAAPALAGALGTGTGRFLVFELLGSVLWVAVLAGSGWIFSEQLEIALTWLIRVGGTLAGALLALFVAWAGIKAVQRWRVLREIRVARIGVEELKRKLDAAEDLVVLDLRHAVELAADPRTIPGALHVPAEELDARWPTIPRDRELVLFCT